ncbi:CFI-box-CTERM domain-containing protein [Variovorax sp.]|uniref:CFI-box-CTERM domain-containing protein n=1 Tax=Variovorax sp. TaxID=1871043 RepID=UPI003BA8D284
MVLVAAVCPQCSGALQIPEERDFVKCQYCGTDIMVREPVRPAQYVRLVQPAAPAVQAPANPAHLRELGREALEAGNAEEAYSYFGRALELDPKDAQAWTGRADALALASGAYNLRFKDMIAALDNAREASPPEQQALLLKAHVEKVKAVLFPLHAAARDQLVANPSSDLWFSYLGQFEIFAQTAEFLHRRMPDDTEIIEFLIEAHRAAIEGAIGPAQEPDFVVDDKQEQKLRAAMEAYSEKLAVFKPGYEFPTVYRAQKGDCFVVTATMGDAAHPSVTLLRNFRDKRLARTAAGRSFIAWYYAHGPALARQVARSEAIRSAAYVLVVAPAATLVRVFEQLVKR